MPDLLAALQGEPGTYALVFHCDAPVSTRVGRLGLIRLPVGYWVYVGSAFGPGGLRARLGHHLKPSARPHWHVDYIKGAMIPVAVWTTVDPLKREHAWAAVLSGIRGARCPVAGFGASDCDCPAHLVHLSHCPSLSGFRARIRRMDRSHAPIRGFALR
ncbi:conserved hypothetical protein [Desulfosarcina cetonica]|uniref:GIY-YIG nuclease family protein n=1 Tax=Desulfosarcina cetonica TaxID=90730 RepID=UPI0006CF5758|nr:GIY-YIG nuclease family protein [Desulfosarcina cetonica]VTR68932.1 conserved hypothetical protein [Desulfosarcina cetonica]